MSNPRLLIGLSCVGIVLLLAFGPGSESPELPTEEGVTATASGSGGRQMSPIAMPSEYAQLREREGQEGIAKEQIKAMQAAFDARKRREEIIPQTEFQWEQQLMRNEWKLKRLIDTNLGLFELMKIQARSEDDRELRCRICDGTAKLEVCIICDSKGKCPSCFGTGRERHGPERPCAVCEGRKTCFHCVGSKKMNCPFCEKGRITTVTPWPKYKLELP